MPAHAHVREHVVLVHGLWFGGWLLTLLRWRLRRHGYAVHVVNYRTVRDDLRVAAARVHAAVGPLAAHAPIHLVGYSLGGIALRAYLHFYPAAPTGRMVTLGSPHHGSHAAQSLARVRLGRFALGRWLLGRCMAALLARAPAQWPLPARDVGAIAGTVSAGLGRLFPGLPRPNDGTVAVSETALPGRPLLLLPVSHLGLVLSPQVAQAIARFLRSGRFDR